MRVLPSLQGALFGSEVLPNSHASDDRIGKQGNGVSIVYEFVMNRGKRELTHESQVFNG